MRIAIARQDFELCYTEFHEAVGSAFMVFSNQFGADSQCKLMRLDN